MSDPVTLTIGGKRPPDPGSVRLVATLAVAAMLSGMTLSVVYEWTRPVIAANKARALRAAVFEVVPDAVRLEHLAWSGDALLPVEEGARSTAPSIFAAYDDRDRLAGFALQGSGAGFQDTIELLFGLDPRADRVTGMFVLQSRETPGLGDKIYKDGDFVANFTALEVEPEIALVKDGRANPNEVDAITGATISSRAVVRIINDTLAEWRPRLATLTVAPQPTAQEPDDG